MVSSLISALGLEAPNPGPLIALALSLVKELLPPTICFSKLYSVGPGLLPWGTESKSFLS